jgi:hypothetical protein
MHARDRKLRLKKATLLSLDQEQAQNVVGGTTEEFYCSIQYLPCSIFCPPPSTRGFSNCDTCPAPRPKLEPSGYVCTYLDCPSIDYCP